MAQSLAAKLAGIVLPEAGGASIRLGELWAQSPVLLSFLRHYG